LTDALFALAAAGGSGSTGCTIAPDGSAVQNLCTAANSLHIQVAYRSILPLLVLTIGALVVLAVSAVLPKRSRPGLYPLLTVVVGAASLGTAIFQWYDVSGPGVATIGGQVYYDRFSVLFSILVSIAVMLSAIAADSYLRREGLDGVEAYVLMLMSASGAVLMAEAGSLIMLFLGLEIMSIALYVLAAYHRRRAQSGEAGLKYFILGSFSSALFLYGIALVYGATGTVYIAGIDQFLSKNVLANNGVLLAGLALLIVGLGFKVAAVPFHFWTPDVYQGSPTPFTGFMAAVAKAAGFAGLLRVLTEAMATQRTDWRPIIWLVAVLTLLVGSVLAIASRDLKRMLAYSSISQAGYVLVGVQAGSSTGTSAALFYLFTYTFIVIGSFAVVDAIQGRGEARPDIRELRGLSRREPLLAAAMLVLLLAQAGVPFTSGFLGKFYVIQASVEQGQYYLAVVAMVAAAVAAFFYLRVTLLMYAPAGSADSPGSAAEAPAAGSATVGSWAPADSAGYEADVFEAGLAPVAGLDGEAAGVGGEAAGVGGVAVMSSAADQTSLTATPAPTERAEVSAGLALVMLISVGFTIAAGVAPFAVDFAKAAFPLF
jgi:NADH-quinone oxidoreductase subunit N